MRQPNKTNYTSSHQGTTTSHATGAVAINKRQLFKIVLIVLGGVLIWSSPFWAEPFRYQKDSLVQLRNIQSEKIKSSEAKIQDLRTNYENGNISDLDYIQELHKEVDQLKSAQNSEEIKQYYSENKILDWTNSYVFFIALGTRIPSVIFPLLLIYLWKVDIIKAETKKLKTAFLSFIVATLGNGIFWMVWVFWPSNNLSFNSYVITISIYSLLIATALAQFLLWRKVKIEKLKNVIQQLNHVLITIIPQRINNLPVKEYEEIKWKALEYQADEG